MIDRELRAALAPAVERIARVLARIGIRPLAVTMVGLALAVAAAAAAANASWRIALTLWLLSRIPDGVDGPLARVTDGGTPLGGWADISADLTAYGAFIVGCAIGNPDARIACLVLLLTYYVNGGSMLALSAAAAQRGVARPDERTFLFSRGLAEGAETIVVHSIMVLIPAWMAAVAWTFSAMVLATIFQRIRLAVHLLG